MANRPKTIQINFDLFLSIIDYFYDHTDETDYRYEDIARGIQEKLNAMFQRELYTLYKTGATPELRAAARKRYLEEMGISRSFQWPDEQDVNVMRQQDPEV